MTNIATILVVGGMTTSGFILGEALSSATYIESGDAVKIGAAAVGLALWINNKFNRVEARNTKRFERVAIAIVKVEDAIANLACHRTGICPAVTSDKMLEKVRSLLHDEPTTTKV